MAHYVKDLGRKFVKFKIREGLGVQNLIFDENGLLEVL